MSDDREAQNERTSAPSASEQAASVYDVESHLVPERDPFPNNPLLPVLYYRQAVELDLTDPAGSLEAHFLHNGWGYSWRNGIFPYHHYHSTAHEVLGIAAGQARVQLGGDGGIEITMRAGDVLVIPAGVALCNLESSVDLIAVGAYPPGQVWDVNTGEDDERPRTDEKIARLPAPETDPVFGEAGPILDLWTPSRD